MVSNDIKIFLLTPADTQLEKIVWADSEDSARTAGDDHLLKEKKPGDKVAEMKDGIYSDSKTSCVDITNKIEDLKISDNVISFTYCDNQIFLTKDKAELINKK
ncbi:MAG: hypothetical protein A3F13_09855 [Gammaproteobacteria bacterium RIFCSPHIGHO2_12_FULL_40_19]|nr:MAG: hypothetical protein A3F13_09855 [Gammaproteobacteria bacterium RIFCSPHIGHO2_12_FULL_40_19]